MSQIQNNILHNVFQPIALMAGAYIAGSKRFIRYFPGASQGGLCLTAGLGVGATLISPHITTLGFLKTDHKNESAMHSFMRVTASLAVGILTAQALKGRVSFCLHAATRFIVLEGLLVALPCAGISYCTVSAPTPGGGTPQTLEEKHATYQKDLDSWNKLDGKERAALAKEYFDKNLDLLPLEKGEFDTKPFKNRPEDFSMLTINQLEWYTEIYHYHLDLPVDKSITLNEMRG